MKNLKRLVDDVVCGVLMVTLPYALPLLFVLLIGLLINGIQLP